MKIGRRKFLRAGGGAVLAGAAGNADAALETSTTQGQWSQFCRNSRNTGYAPETDAPTSNVGTRWEFQAEDSVESSPVVANGVVFVGSDDGRLYALDATDGSKQWSFDAGSEISSAPAVDGGTVFVVTKDTSVYALKGANGAEQWSVQNAVAHSHRRYLGRPRVGQLYAPLLRAVRRIEGVDAHVLCDDEDSSIVDCRRGVDF